MEVITMKKYNVQIPISGYVSVTVDAKNEQDAIDRAWESAELDDIAEWDLHHKIVEGNNFWGIRNEVEVELIEDYDEDEEGGQ
jgi:hypothetical protein